MKLIKDIITSFIFMRLICKMSELFYVVADRQRSGKSDLVNGLVQVDFGDSPGTSVSGIKVNPGYCKQHEAFT